MRITQFRTRPQAAARVITSPKCETAIPARNVLLRDAIIQASLDPAVLKIEFAPLPVPDPSLALNALVVERDGQRLLLDNRMAAKEKPRSIDDEGALLLALEDLGLQLIELDPRGDPQGAPVYKLPRGLAIPPSRSIFLSDRLQIMQDSGGVWSPVHHETGESGLAHRRRSRIGVLPRLLQHPRTRAQSKTIGSPHGRARAEVDGLDIERKQQTDLLARAYLDILEPGKGRPSKAMLRRDDPDDPTTIAPGD